MTPCVQSNCVFASFLAQMRNVPNDFYPWMLRRCMVYHLLDNWEFLKVGKEQIIKYMKYMYIYTLSIFFGIYLTATTEQIHGQSFELVSETTT